MFYFLLSTKLCTCLNKQNTHSQKTLYNPFAPL
jgi:hypothetical protein